MFLTFFYRLLWYIMWSNYGSCLVMLIIVTYPLVKCQQGGVTPVATGNENATNNQSTQFVMNCYQCKSEEDPICDAESVSDEYLKPCDMNGTRSYYEIELPDNILKSKDIYCRKIVQYLSFINNTPITLIARECTLFHKNVEKCYEEITQAFTITVCECKADGCNAAILTMNVSRFLLIVTVSLLIFSDFPP